MKIGLLSDTHGYFDPQWKQFLGDCQEIWHAGDIGRLEVAQFLESLAPLQAVYGNIDGPEIRQLYPEHLHLEREGIRIWITHILTPTVKRQLPQLRPDLLVFGHSHVVKAERDKHGVFQLNPGACGRQGFHQVKTLVTMELLQRQVKNLRIHDLGPR